MKTRATAGKSHIMDGTLGRQDYAVSGLLTGRNMTDAGTATPVTIVIPCFNEEESIPQLYEKLARLERQAPAYCFHYIFVDDASTDGTSNTLKLYFGDRPNATLLRNARNLGIAGSTVNGIRAARTEIVCSMDCDCTFDPEHLAVMLPMLRDDVALVTASPYHPEGRVEGVPSWRIALSRGAATMYRAVLRQKLASYTACFRVYRRSAIPDYNLRYTGFVGITEILAKMDLSGGRIVEAPAVLGVRQFGQSKMNIFRTTMGHVRLVGRCMLARMHLGSV